MPPVEDEVREKRVWVFSSDFYEGNMASIYWGIPDNIEKTLSRNSLVGQWLGLHAFTARDPGSNPSPGSKILQTALALKQKQTKRCLPRERFAKATYIYAILHVWLRAKAVGLKKLDSHSLRNAAILSSSLLSVAFWSLDNKPIIGASVEKRLCLFRVPFAQRMNRTWGERQHTWKYDKFS